MTPFHNAQLKRHIVKSRTVAFAVIVFILILAAPAVSEILFDRTGRLADGGPRLQDGSLYDEHTLAVRAGDRLVVTLESRDFDPYLVVVLPDERVEENDDITEQNTNCRLEITVPTSGTLKIVANAYAAQSSGAYRLRVTRTGGPAGTSAEPASRQGGSRQGGSRQGSSSTARSTSPTSSSSAMADNAWISGRLEPGDRTHTDGSYLDQYTFEGRRGEEVTIRLESTDFDPYLFLTGPGDFKESNDDADGQNSRITVTLPANGTYQVIVNSFGEGAKRGNYRVRLNRTGGQAGSAATTSGSSSTASSSSSTGAIRLGETIRGRLEPGDRTHRDGSFIDQYTFRGRAGQVVTARLESSDFDAYLFLQGPNNFNESNDDADGTNARITATFPAAGEYRFIVNSFESGPRPGAYTLSLVEGSSGEAPAASGARSQALTLGRAVDGRLADGDATLSSGELHDIYTVSLQRGQAVTADLSSSDFDPYLFVRGPGNFSEDNDDYQGSSSRSRIEFTAPEAGTYRIAVTSYKPGEAGAYRLHVTDPTADRPAPTPSAGTASGAATRLSPGQTITGRLGAGSARLSSGELYDRYVYRAATAGERITVEMSSTDLDAYLFIRGPGNFSQDNDDANDGSRDARLEVTLPRAGEYTIHATSYQQGEAGAYRLAVRSGGAGAPPATPVTPDPVRPTPPGTRPPADHTTGVSSGGGRVYGIFVGITNYPDPDDNLPYCADDARKLAQALRTAGISVATDQRVLIDRDATRANFRRAIADIGSRVGPNDLFIVFFSGHGSQTEDRANSTERDRREESLLFHDGELQDDEMGRLLGGIRSRMAILAIDACFAGGFRDALNRPEQLGIFSSEEDLTSAVAAKFSAGGYLSHFLHSGLLGGADSNRDSRVSVGELCEYLYRRYAREASGVESETLEGHKSFQHLVIDRGGVKVGDLILSLGGVPAHLKVAPATR